MAFLFGVAGVDELPGLLLVGLLGDLGIGPAAARGRLARMRSEGQLVAVRRGREVGYRMQGAFLAAFRRLAAPPSPPPWTGRFHAVLHHVPEEHRAYRDRLRRMALFAGYGVLQPGVLIAVRDLSAAVAPVLAEAPPGVRLHTGELGLADADAAAVARTAWDLDDLAARLRGHAATLAAAVAHDERPSPSALALRRYAELASAPLVDLVADPGLPGVLLPADWPGPALGRHLDAVHAHYWPATSTYVRAR